MDWLFTQLCGSFWRVFFNSSVCLLTSVSISTHHTFPSIQPTTLFHLMSLLPLAGFSGSPSTHSPSPPCGHIAASSPSLIQPSRKISSSPHPSISARIHHCVRELPCGQWVTCFPPVARRGQHTEAGSPPGHGEGSPKVRGTGTRKGRDQQWDTHPRALSLLILSRKCLAMKGLWSLILSLSQSLFKPDSTCLELVQIQPCKGFCS